MKFIHCPHPFSESEVQKFNREYSLNTDRSSIPSKSNINNEHASNYSHQANFIELAKDNAGTELSQPHNNIEAAFRQNSPEDNTAVAVMESTSLNTENHGIYDQISSPNASGCELPNPLTFSDLLPRVENEQNECCWPYFPPTNIGFASDCSIAQSSPANDNQMSNIASTNAIQQQTSFCEYNYSSHQNSLAQPLVSNHIEVPPSTPLNDEGYTDSRKRRGDTTIEGSHNIKKQKIVRVTKSSCNEKEDSSPTRLESRACQISGHKSIGNNTNIAKEND